MRSEYKGILSPAYFNDNTTDRVDYVLGFAETTMTLITGEGFETFRTLTDAGQHNILFQVSVLLADAQAALRIERAKHARKGGEA
jgi:hypothetical protein